jgi:hypothetical protein
MRPPGALRSPPRARLAFRVGVLGHRPNRLPTDFAALERLRLRLRETLEAVKAAVEDIRGRPETALYASEAPVLRALSPLAEGADRLFAETALDLGYSLCCPMPFAQELFEQDFADRDSIRAFRDLLAKAGDRLTRFEMDGDRTDPPAAYAAAGRVVVNQSDLLVVVWDGGPAAGSGGTVNTLREALDYRVPVLWIDALEDHGWMLLRSADDLDRLPEVGRRKPAWRKPFDQATRAADGLALRAEIAEAVEIELAAPEASMGGGFVARRRSGAEIYFAQRRPLFNYGLIWKPFRDFVGSGRIGPPRWRVRDFVTQIQGEWPASERDAAPGRPAPTPVVAWTNQALRAHFAWADGAADLYADAHRSAYLAASFLAAFAVFLALLPMASGASAGGSTGGRVSMVAEIIVLAATISLMAGEKLSRWRQRWLDYRVLAELIREIRILIPLGGGRPLPSTPVHLAVYGDPKQSWMYWHMRAVARLTGIPDARIDFDYIDERLDHLLEIATGQIAFHDVARRRSHAIHRRLHAAAMGLFALSALTVFVELLVPMAPRGWAPAATLAAANRWMVLFDAVAPAVGAALATINNQGEFARLAKRSQAMVEGLSQVRDRTLALRGRIAAGAPPRLVEVITLARDLSTIMVDENADWRVVVLDLAHGAS